MKTIICPVDFSDIASRSIDYACLFAQRMHANLLLLHIVEEEKIPRNTEKGSPYTAPGGHERLINHKLDTLKDDIEMRFGISARTRIEYGAIDDLVLKVAEEISIELIVMGTTGASSLGDIFKGTNAVKVVSKIDYPILIIPKDAEFTIPLQWVYATDMVGNEEEVVREVTKFSDLFQGTLELLHVRQDKKERTLANVHHPEYDNLQSDTNLSYTEIKDSNILKGINKYVGVKDPDILVISRYDEGKWDWLIKEDKVSKIVENANFPILVIHERR